jgi:hypothetical protein
LLCLRLTVGNPQEADFSLHSLSFKLSGFSIIRLSSLYFRLKASRSESKGFYFYKEKIRLDQQDSCQDITAFGQKISLKLKANIGIREYRD